MILSVYVESFNLLGVAKLSKKRCLHQKLVKFNRYESSLNLDGIQDHFTSSSKH